MTYAVVAQSWGPLHTDMTEMWAWGKEFQLGYNKHPPFAAWLAGLWFSIMPRAHWSFYLFAALNGAAGLAGVWALSGLFLGTLGRWTAMLLLALTPSFTFWVLKYNANAPLLSLWPWAAYFFVWSLQTRQASAGVAAGLVGAAALLTKYYSLVLFATFFCVALLHPDRRRYFLSPVPYITMAVGLVAVLPHVWWLYSDGFGAVEYAISKAEYDVGEARRDTIQGALGALASLGVAAAALAVAFGRDIGSVTRRSLAGNIDMRTAWVTCLSDGPFVFSMAAYGLGNVRVISSYLLPVFFALPLGFLATARAEVAIAQFRRLALCFAAVWLAALLASPLVGYFSWFSSGDGWREPRQEVADAATKAWHDRFGQPLRYVSGSEDLAKAVTFYSRDTPSYLLLASFFGRQRRMTVDEARRPEGVLFICREVDAWCVRMTAGLVGEGAIRYEQTFTPRFLGYSAEPQHFTFFAQPPRNVAPAAPANRRSHSGSVRAPPS